MNALKELCAHDKTVNELEDFIGRSGLILEGGI